METNQICAIIKDLIPNYLENLTSEQTNEFIEKHLQECEDCKNVYENMNIDLDIKENEDKKIIKFFKKINNKMKILKIIIIIIILIFLGIIIRKFFILNKMANLADSINYNNYYENITETTERGISKIDYYQNNDNFIFIHTKIDKDNKFTQTIEYRYNGEEYSYTEINGERLETNREIIGTNESTIQPMTQYQFLNTSIIGNIGLSLMPGSVKDSTLHYKKCYLINVDNYLNFIDKNTGLTMKEINKDNNSVIDYSYDFGNVNDEKIEELISYYKK